MGRGAARGLIGVLMMALVVLPASARAEHSKLSLESIGPAGGNGAAPADLVGPADAGSRVFVSTAEGLTSADTDASLDLYSRTGGNTVLQSAGNPGGNGAFSVNFGRTGAAGTRVIFQSNEKLTTADSDTSLDVYMREGSTTTLISTGPGSGSFGAFDSYFAATSTDGTRIFFTTRGALVGADNDQALDVYERANGTTTLMSPGGSGLHSVDLAAVTADGTKLFLETTEQLVGTDTDEKQDVYQRAGGTTTLVSTGPGGGNGAHAASFAGMSQDGTKVFFHTTEKLVSSDTDAATDVYERTDGTTTIHSVSPSGGNMETAAQFAGASAGGSKVFIESTERLLAAPVDTDGFNDVYESSGGTLTHVSDGGNDSVATHAYFVGASSDGSQVFFRSEEALVAGDTDQHQDIYQYSGGSITRLSLGPDGGNGPAHAFFGGMSEDGTHVYFQTNESLVASDTDTSTDVYERHADTTYHLSTGPNGGNGTFDATFRAVSSDGRRAFFRTAESLLTADSDSAADLYSANVPGTVTVLLDAVPDSTQDFSFQALGLDDGFDFSPPNFGPTAFTLDDDANPALTNERTFTGVTPGVGYSVTQTAVQGWNLSSACDDGSPASAIDVSPGEHVTCTFTNQQQGQLGYPRPRGATPARFSLVTAYQECQAPNREHGPALTFASCHPPARESGDLTVGTPDSNGAGANFAGSARWEVVVGNPSTPADEADVNLSVSLTDVRLSAGLGDYTGELEGEVMLRIVDRDASVAATVQDFPLTFAVPCTTTGSGSIGSSCALTTSVDALTPGAVEETQRTIWQMDQMKVNDGGPDGQASTQPNSPFARQGVFVP